METLADRLMAWTYDERLPRPFNKFKYLARLVSKAKLECRLNLTNAKRFVLDDDFVRQMVRKSHVTEKPMLGICKLANLPFETIWVEYSNKARIDTSISLGTLPKDIVPEEISAGMLLTRIEGKKPSQFIVNHVMFPAGDGVSDFDLVPWAPLVFGFDIDGRMPPNENKLWSAASWGYSSAKPGAFADATIPLGFYLSEELERYGTAYVDRMFYEKIIKLCYKEDKPTLLRAVREAIAYSIREMRGINRMIVTTLAMINCVPAVYHHREAKGYYHKRLRNIPFLDHTTVTIHTGRRHIDKVVDRAFRAAHARHRRHEVRGFWRDVEYGHAVHGCAHEAIEREGDYAICGKCSHILRWIEHHERGDAALGWVTHDYKVKI